MGMDLDRSIKRKAALKTSIADVISAVRIGWYTSDQMNEAIGQSFAKHCAGAPQWVRSYGEGVRDVHTDMLYRHDLVFGGMIDGKFYSTHRDRADYYEKNGFEPNVYADDGLVKDRGHYWKESVDRGTPKPFFINK
ncbi:MULTISPECIES: hypothetical protein [unclassified Bradyrhizobium]|uniref:hypothetical protein n=1 Tax=unclassified Bradyrhizobium TaxID=2631580 RepID=UPI0033916D30